MGLRWGIMPNEYWKMPRPKMIGKGLPNILSIISSNRLKADFLLCKVLYGLFSPNEMTGTREALWLDGKSDCRGEKTWSHHLPVLQRQTTKSFALLQNQRESVGKSLEHFSCATDNDADNISGALLAQQIIDAFARGRTRTWTNSMLQQKQYIDRSRKTNLKPRTGHDVMAAWIDTSTWSYEVTGRERFSKSLYLRCNNWQNAKMKKCHVDERRRCNCDRRVDRPSWWVSRGNSRQSI